jgi:hypothetical protein
MDDDKHHISWFSWLNEFIANGEVLLGSKESSLEFNNYVTKNFSWTPNSLDWTQFANSKRINIMQISDIEVGEFLNLITVSNYEYIALLYSARQSNYIMKISFFIENLDLMLTLMGQQSYLVGVEKQQSEWKYDCDALAEWKAGWLSGILK